MAAPISASEHALIRTLANKGHSQLRIAALVGRNPKTVAKYIAPIAKKPAGRKKLERHRCKCGALLLGKKCLKCELDELKER